MMKTTTLLLSLFLGLATTLQHAAADDEGTSLFNGKDLTGWKVHGTEKWYIENGELVAKAAPTPPMVILRPKSSIRISN